MATQEVPRENWDAFLGSFSRQHAGVRISLELRHPGLGTMVEVEDGRLEGVLSEHSDDHRRISIIVGDAPESEHITHVVEEPSRMRFNQSETGAQQGLEIEAEEGTTLLRFRPPLTP